MRAWVCECMHEKLHVNVGTDNKTTSDTNIVTATNNTKTDKNNKGFLLLPYLW